MPLNVAIDPVYDWYDLGKLAMASLGLDSCLDGCVGSFFPSSLWQHKVNWRFSLWSSQDEKFKWPLKALYCHVSAIYTLFCTVIKKEERMHWLWNNYQQPDSFESHCLRLWLFFNQSFFHKEKSILVLFIFFLITDLQVNIFSYHLTLRSSHGSFTLWWTGRYILTDNYHWCYLLKFLFSDL